MVIFQEFAMHGNLKDYLQTNNLYVPEEQMHEWARDIYAGLNFLGDAGLCHRAIAPKHVSFEIKKKVSNSTEHSAHSPVYVQC